MNINEKIKKRRKELDLSLQQVADALGVHRSTVLRYETADIEKMPIDVIPNLARVLQCSPEYLMGWTDSINEIKTDNFNFINLPTKKIPIIGTVACGEPILAEENIIGYMDPIEFVNADYCLIAKGDSMINADIEDGDIIYVKQTNQVDNGQIAVVLIGDEATLKRFRRTKDTVMLIAENNEIDPIILSPEEEARIIGLATHITKVLK